ncbi:SET domain containing protein [Novymonas esmeraldas]|uniref:SET domain containing protein n=1 Tax=Novymonas esmeraldas TaxID=1808958 RepID=A0AAW0EVK8_9TRYP
MHRTSRLCASPLLQHIHHSLPALHQLYSNAAAGAAAHHTSPTPPPTTFPPDPLTPEDGDGVLRFFCTELGMGAEPLRRWRQTLHQRSAARWCTADAAVPWTRVGGAPVAAAAAAGASPSVRWLRPRLQDVAVVRSAVRELKLLVSPLLLLSPPPTRTAAATSPPTHTHTARPTSHEECSRWYATHAIPAGMLLLSIPTEAVLFASPPPAADPLLSYFMTVEELVAQLVSAVDDPAAPHHGYAAYLCDSVVPCRNLPFLSVAEVQQLVAAAPTITPPAPAAGAAAAAADVGDTRGAFAGDDTGDGDDRRGSALVSPALSLAHFYHVDMAGEPLSQYLRARLTSAEYAWWVSVILSHRSGSTSVLPMLDKLNHSPLPNCTYTMATAETMCGLDVVDNLVAGVPAELLYQPYVHLCAMRDIPAGAELTVCYASAADSAYRRASRRPPPPPPVMTLTRGLERDGRRAGAPPPRTPPPRSADMAEAMGQLFEEEVDVTAADDVVTAAQLRHLQHPGRQEVDTPEGRASWLQQWGFVPPCDAVYGGQDLREMAALVAERRIDTRAQLFPPPLVSTPKP